MTTATDQLVARAQAGDRAAFERLYREHAGMVYAQCLRMVADSGRAEELAQDAFVRAWDKLPQFAGRSSFSSWLYRLTANVVLSAHRSRSRREKRIRAVDDLEAVERPPAGPAPSGATDLDLERAVAALPAQARTVFLLHDVEGYLHQEIAELLGVAVGTSKAHLHRARRMLREALR